MTTIFKDCKTDYGIIIPKNPAVAEKTAAEELKCYLNKVFGAELEIKEEENAYGKNFYIGHTDYALKNNILATAEENWIIKLNDGNVVLTGGKNKGERGTLYAVYHFLEDIVGVRWWSRWEEHIPSLDELSLEDDFYKSETPFFPFRKILYHDMDDFSYSARTRGNVVGDDRLEGGAYSESVKKYGSALQMGRPHHTHTLNKLFKPEDCFDEHPEWFSWNDAEGKRISYMHFCLTNDEFADAVTEKVLAYIKEDYELEKTTGVKIPYFYSVSFPDCMGGFCQCEKCKKVLEESGESGYALKFVNKVAKEIAKIYPEVKIETLIYAVYLNPPKDDTLPEKNVILRLAQIYSDIIQDITHPNNAWYYKLLKAWSEICKKAGCELHIWEYMYNLWADVTMPIAFRLGDAWREFAKYGVEGIFVENEHRYADMWELNQYLLNKLSEDPYADADALIDDFIKLFYGKAAKYVKEYLYELKRSKDEHPVSAFCTTESVHFSYIDDLAVTKGILLLDKAFEEAKGDDVLTCRVSQLMTMLKESAVIKYYDLKKMAKLNKRSFDLDIKALRDDVLEGLKKMQEHPKFSGADSYFNAYEDYFKNLCLTEDIAPLPEELKGENPDDVYHFFFKNSCRQVTFKNYYGVSFVDDKGASCGRAEKITIADADPLETIALHATSKHAEYPAGVLVKIRHNDEYTGGVELYLEDIVPDKYHTYKIGSVSGIKTSTDTRLDIFGNNLEWLSLSGISQVMPMDACDVYLTMKFTGKGYGGVDTEPDAVYLDRAIVVRKG